MTWETVGALAGVLSLLFAIYVYFAGPYRRASSSNEGCVTNAVFTVVAIIGISFGALLGAAVLLNPNTVDSGNTILGMLLILIPSVYIFYMTRERKITLKVIGAFVWVLLYEMYIILAVLQN